MFLGLKNVQRLFLAEKDIDVVVGQEGYSIPDRLAFNKHVHQVAYSHTGRTEDFLRLEKQQLFNRSLDSSNSPMGYFMAQGKVNLSAVPSQSGAKLRVSYDRAVDNLDIRRGGITVVTGLTSTGFTSITIATSPDETSAPNLSTIDYICINSPDGDVRAYNIPVGGYNTGTDVLTPRAGFTFAAGESIAVGDFVTFGKYTTTHGKLPDECERYLIHYAVQCIFQQESSTDIITQNANLVAMEQEIMKGYAAQSGEIQMIPMLTNYEY
jgi:hypothetical protein